MITGMSKSQCVGNRARGSQQGQQAHLDSVTDVLILDDDRVSAIVQISETRSLVIFAKSGICYLIDAPYGSPGGSTPTP